jgi:predicted nucleic acid-binding protein
VKPFFLDTNYLVALESSEDLHHIEAISHWRSLLKNVPPLVTTSYIFDETVTFFKGRHQHAKAAQVGNRLLRSSAIDLIHVDESLFYEGWQFLLKHDDKTYSLTDCISFVVMKKRGLKNALTFDNHFNQAGFATLP